MVVDGHAPPGAIADRLRRVAREEDASLVFVGSANAGRLVTLMSSVGSSVAAEATHDVVLVRHRRPSKVVRLRDATSSDVYRTE